MNWNALGVRPADFLIPQNAAAHGNWACVACDQYTSQPEYWQRVADRVQDAPSTLHMIVPECNLQKTDELLPAIHETMRRYVHSGTLAPCVQNGMVLTARTTQSGTRVGLVLAVDLECYDYRKGAVSLIRATEQTIESRLPARMKVRRGALLETAHVLMLCNDLQHTVIDPLWQNRHQLRPVYDFELMENGGHLSGWAVEDETTLARVYTALDALRAAGGEHPFLFAVGDGNHSLASAKAFWEECKASLPPQAQLTHPARFAMVELENINDPALTFEPIHRVVFGCDCAALQSDFEAWLIKNGMTLRSEAGPSTHEMTFVFGNQRKAYHIDHSPYGIAVATLQTFLDAWLSAHAESELDYVHGDDTVLRLAQADGTLGVLLPKPDGSSLFEGVVKNGCLPRKTFSLGEANEKRFYMECRVIR